MPPDFPSQENYGKLLDCHEAAALRGATTLGSFWSSLGLERLERHVLYATIDLRIYL